MQFGEGEFFRKEFEGRRSVAKLGGETLSGSRENLVVVEGQLGDFVEGEPSGVVGVGIGCRGMFEEVDEGEVGNGNDVFAWVAAGLAEGIKLFEVDVL